MLWPIIHILIMNIDSYFVSYQNDLEKSYLNLLYYSALCKNDRRQKSAKLCSVMSLYFHPAIFRSSFCCSGTTCYRGTSIIYVFTFLYPSFIPKVNKTDPKYCKETKTQKNFIYLSCWKIVSLIVTLLYRVPLDSKGKNFVIFISRICLLTLEANAFRR